jgi:esterase/lipase
MHLHVEKQGKGKPILLLHGLMSDHRQLEPLLAALQGYRLFIPDLPGCGQSSKEASEEIVRETIKALKALCKKHKIRTVVGYSLGGIFAIELQLPNTILLSTFCTNPTMQGTLHMLAGKEARVAQLIKKNEQVTERFLRKYVKNDNKVVPGIKDASVPCARLYLIACEEDRTEKAKRLKKVLVLHGTKDKLIDHRFGLQLATITKAQFVSVPEGHYTILQNDTVHAAISAFVQAASL